MSEGAAARTPTIAVCGPGEATDAELAAAERVGHLLAERGCVVVCGGLGGVMAAVCRGAKTGGGTTIGILPGYEARAANPWLDHVVCTGLGQARNAIVAATGQALIAVSGGFGTLSEIALGLRLGRPVVLLGGWAATFGSAEGRAALDAHGRSPLIAQTAADAVAQALAALVGR